MSIDLVFHSPRMCHYPEAHGRLGWVGRTQFDFAAILGLSEHKVRRAKDAGVIRQKQNRASSNRHLAFRLCRNEIVYSKCC
jgi:hypothetical protein